MSDKKSFQLAKSDKEAAQKFEQYKQLDPYPEIGAALLNSADIMAYIKATSLIYPFDEACLQGASYDVKVFGEVVYWDKDGIKQSVQLKSKEDYFELCPNSIAFVTIEPTFRIPDYLALRFNLKITHIYKGLLLGTGPLVDPGFVGKLSIPLHNLTANTYRFNAFDQLITMEFTKMSPNILWDQMTHESSETYKPNIINANRGVSEYIGKALKKDGLNTVISSIPKAMLESQESVKKSEESVKKSEEAVNAVKHAANLQTYISVAAVCALIISCIGFSLNALNKANDRYDTLRKEYESTKTEYLSRIEDLEYQIDDLIELIENEAEKENIDDSNANSN